MSKAVAAERRYRAVVQIFIEQPRVTVEGKGLGSDSLRVGGKIFALLSSQKEFAVKLPRRRVEELTKSQDGHPCDPEHGRLMKEWLGH